MYSQETLNSSTSYYLRKILAEYHEMTNGVFNLEDSIQSVDFYDLLNNLYQSIAIEQKAKELVVLSDLHKQLSNRDDCDPQNLAELERRILRILLGKNINVNESTDRRLTKVDRISIQDLLKKIESIKDSSTKFLGTKMTTRYLLESRPEDEWLEQFSIDPKAHITFSGSFFDSVDSAQQGLFEQWIQDFIALCSKTIPNFHMYIEQKPSDIESTKILGESLF